MAADDVPGPKNQPRFKGTGAPASAADLNIATAYAAKLGGMMVDTASVRTNLPAADLWEGLRFTETDTGITYRRVNNGWLRETPQAIVTTGPTQTGIVSPATVVTSLQLVVVLPAPTTLAVTLQLQTYSTAAGDVMAIGLRDSEKNNASVAEWSRGTNSGGASTGNSQLLGAVLPQVAAGTHTYSVVVIRAAGTGQIAIAPTATSPNFLQIEAIS